MMNKELMMFYNVENFFPSDQNSTSSKTSGLYNWNDYKYQLKVKKIGNVFRFIKDDFGQTPSIIGLAEIGEKTILEDLIHNNTELSNYDIIYEKSNDSRGLSVALLYNQNKLTLLNKELITSYNKANKAFETRDILKARFLIDGKKLSIFIVHLPSKRQQDIKKNMRESILHSLKESILPLTEKSEAVIVMGDFNENPTNQNIQSFLLDKNGNLYLENPFIDSFQRNQFTTFHGNQGLGFDQIIYSKKALVNNFNFKTITAKIYDNQKLKIKNSKHPNRTYSGSRYIGGYSDHFPILLELEK